MDKFIVNQFLNNYEIITVIDEDARTSCRVTSIYNYLNDLPLPFGDDDTIRLISSNEFELDAKDCFSNYIRDNCDDTSRDYIIVKINENDGDEFLVFNHHYYCEKYKMNIKDVIKTLRETGKLQKEIYEQNAQDHSIQILDDELISNFDFGDMDDYKCPFILNASNELHFVQFFESENDHGADTHTIILKKKSLQFKLNGSIIKNSWRYYPLLECISEIEKNMIELIDFFITTHFPNDEMNFQYRCAIIYILSVIIKKTSENQKYEEEIWKIIHYSNRERDDSSNNKKLYKKIRFFFENVDDSDKKNKLKNLLMKVNQDRCVYSQNGKNKCRGPFFHLSFKGIMELYRSVLFFIKGIMELYRSVLFFIKGIAEENEDLKPS
ncbi:MAG: hypothetical protein ACTSUE_01180 [Promethearchaeota archaeon]